MIRWTVLGTKTVVLRYAEIDVEPVTGAVFKVAIPHGQLAVLEIEAILAVHVDKPTVRQIEVSVVNGKTSIEN